MKLIVAMKPIISSITLLCGIMLYRGLTLSDEPSSVEQFAEVVLTVEGMT